MNPQRTRTLLYLFISCLILVSVLAGALSPAPAAAQTPTCVTSRISASADDAEQHSGTGEVDLNGDTSSSSLQMFRTWGSSGTGTRNYWGLRFLNVAVPQGATITSASITFRANQASGTTASGMTLWGQLATNPTTFVTATASNEISSRARTTATASWSVPTWTSGSDYATPSLTAIVQEIVNQSGWASNNAMVIIGQATADQNRRASSYDSTNGSTLAPLLSVCYTTAPASPTITVTGALSPFGTTPGTPSAAQTYTVAGAGLTADIAITAPAGFELSTNGTTYSAALTLPQTSGTVAATTIYARLTGAALGSYGGDITHTSTGATQVILAASGVVMSVCETVNLVTVDDGYLSASGTTNNYGARDYMRITSSGTSTEKRGSLLKWDLSAIPTDATVTATSMTVDVSTASTGVYNLYNMRRAWVEGTGVGSETGDGFTWVTYDGVNNWGTAGAANTSSDRYDTNLWGAGSTSFSTTGSKTLSLNPAGVAAVQGWVTTPATNYGVTMQDYVSTGSTLNLELSTNNHATVANRPLLNVTYCYNAGPMRTLTAANDGHGTVTLTPAGGSYVDGRTVTLTPVPASGFIFDHWSGANAADIVNTSGVYTIVMNGDKAVTANFVVSTCTDVTLVVAEDTTMRSGSTRSAWNYGGATTVRVNPFYEQGSTDGQLTGALLKWNLSGVTLPAGATINAASMRFNVSSGSNYAYGLYNMRRAWVEGTNNGATGTGASYTYYGAATGNWGTEGAANTTSDRFDVNLWDATAAQFNTTGDVSFALNAAGLDVIEGWLDGSLTNNGVTIQNYSGTTIDVWEAASSEATTDANRPRLIITYCTPPTGPTITTSGTLQPFTAIIGQPSAEQAYSVSAVNLTEALQIVAPTDFQVSLTAVSGYGSSLSLTPTGGSVSATIHVRFLRATAGAASDNIAHRSAGATPREVAVSGTATSAPPTISLQLPADDATNVATAPTLQASVSDPEGDTMTVSFYGRVAGEGTGDEFTFVAIPDTQNEAQYYPATMSSQFQWIVSQHAATPYAFVTNLGDIVNTASDSAQWNNADAAYDLLDAGNVPYSVSPGNHDIGGLYNTYFGPSRFEGNGYYQGPMSAGDNENNYSFFSAGGMDFILINLTYSPTTAQIDWADALLKANTDRRGIVVQHDILNINNSYANQTSFTSLRDNPNLFLMLCGHMHSASDGSAYRAETGTDGHTIHVLMTDFQDYTNGGNGYLRLLRFVPAEDKIAASIYSPTLASYLTSSSNYEQFDMAYDMAASAPFALIGTVTGVSNGSVSLPWPDLDTTTEYEWYAIVSDGSTPVDSATWSFTTGSGTPVTYALSVTKSGSGSVSSSPAGIDCGATCSANFNHGTIVSLTAAPATGYSFSGWGGGLCTGTGTCTVTMDAAKSVTANFALNTYSLTIAASPAAGGTTNPAVGSSTRNHGEVVNITATANAGYTFSGWSGACDGTGACSVTMTEAKSVTANFTLNTYALTVTKSGTGSGTVTSLPAGINCGADCNENFTYGTLFVLTAAPDVGSTFAGWSGACIGASTCTLSMGSAMSVNANFTLNTYALTIAASPAAGGTTNPAVGTSTRNHGEVVNITATANAGYTFSGWSGACTGNTTCNVTMDAAKTVTANFTLNAYALSVAKSGAGSGTITSSPTGIDCGADCSESYSHGTVVVLTATPATGSAFAGWTGACSSTGTCTVTMDAAKSVNAEFAAITYALTVSADPAAGGSTTPSGVTTHAQGAVVPVTATPNTGYTFDHWSGACEGSGTCSVTMDAAKSVIAHFTLNSYALTMAVNPAGGGTTTPTGTSNHSHGTVVNITATPAANFSFVNWTGADASCSTLPACTVTMDGAKTVTANFAASSFVLTVTKSGTGFGTVTSDPAGINCGSTCQASYAVNKGVGLGATPDPGSTFSGWSGLCGGAGGCSVIMTNNATVNAIFTLNSYNLTMAVSPAGGGTTTPTGVTSHTHGTVVNISATPAAGYSFVNWTGADASCSTLAACTVSMDAAKSVTANFALNASVLSVTKSGTGYGTVTSAPAGIDCGATCAAAFNSGQEVVLTAAATTGSTFAGWSGSGCTGTGTCSVTMDAAKSVNAEFTAITYALTVSADPAAGGSTSPSGVTTHAQGAVVPVTATPNTGYTFDHWSGACSGNGACSVTMDAAKSVIAHFTLNSYTLTMGVSPAGGGTTTPTGSSNHSHGTVVNITASPSLGYSFAGWTNADAGCSTLPACTVTMDAAKTVTANFTLNSYTLTVSKVGDGTVTSAPAGIDCGADCSENYAHGTIVALTASPAAGFTFGGWSGACSGNTTCSVTMSTARNVVATFNAIPNAPTVTSVDPASGPATGGTALTVHGTNFAGGATVSLGGAACTGVAVVDATQLTCTTPAHAAGAVAVTVTNPNALTGTLPNGFTFTSTAATISLSSVSGLPNAELTVRLDVANIQGLLAGDLVIHFDPAVVQIMATRKGTLIAGNDWLLTSNVPQAGELLLSFAGTNAISGSGLLAEIDIKLIGGAGATSTLDLFSALLNGGAITATLVDGSATVSPLYTISGVVSYWDEALPVPGVALALDGDADFSAQSDAAGAYQIGNVPGDDYLLTPSFSDAVEGISAYDASLVLQHAVRRITLSGPAATAADVDASGAINSMDASYILQKTVNLIALPFPNVGKIWAFAPASLSYTGLNANQPAQNFTAILIGDPSGSWGDVAPLSASGDAVSGPSVKLSVGAPEADGTRTVLVKLAPAAGQQAWSLELEVDFDGAAYTALNPLVTGSWMMASNDAPPGKLHVAMAGAEAVTAPTQLLTLRFKPISGQLDPTLTIKSVLVDDVVGTGAFENFQIMLPLVKGR